MLIKTGTLTTILARQMPLNSRGNNGLLPLPAAIIAPLNAAHAVTNKCIDDDINDDNPSDVSE